MAGQGPALLGSGWTLLGITAGEIVFLTTNIIQTVAVSYGLGKSIDNIHAAERSRTIYWNLVLISTIIFDFCVPKFAFAALVGRRQRLRHRSLAGGRGGCARSRSCSFSPCRSGSGSNAIPCPSSEIRSLALAHAAARTLPLVWLSRVRSSPPWWMSCWCCGQ